MWIKEQDLPLKKSHFNKLNFLYKSDKVYIMDNHLAAGWSWLDILDVNEKYNLLHIDRHYDLAFFSQHVKNGIVDKGISLHTLDLNGYLDLSQLIDNGETRHLFQWDNYIRNLDSLYPNLFGKKYFFTHKEGTTPNGFIDNEIEFFDLISNLNYYIETHNKNLWIINLDIDYFFANQDGKVIQVFSDEFIHEFALSLKNVLDEIAVLTICLSPECCGNWTVAYEKAKLICKVLEIDFVLNLKDASFN